MSGSDVAGDLGTSDHVTPMGLFTPVLEWVVAGINAVGVVVLVWGVAVGMAGFLRIELRRLRGSPFEAERTSLRQSVGYYLLLALELLIAADIIETMIKPTLNQLALLGGVVVIRIATSYALGRELMHAEEKQSKEGDG